MTLALVLPGLVAIGVGLMAGYVRWLASPTNAVRLLAVLAALTSGVALLTVLATVSGLAARSAVGAAIVDACPRLGPNHEVSGFEGVLGATLLALMTYRVLRVVRTQRRAVRGTRGRRVMILRSDEPIAYAAPGTPGCVVVSTGLMRVLDSDERRVVFAHERAHLRHHHHRYLLVAALSVAILPVLSRIASQLRLAVERCADEAAVIAMGGDRRLVARSIGRAALATVPFDGTVGGIAGGSVTARVEALLAARPARLGWRLGLAGGMIALVVGAGSLLQLHHFYDLVAHVCS